jgi:MFS transporter, DHA3 family, macrolide efflux protein
MGVFTIIILKDYQRIFRIKNYRLLFFANFTSQFGSVTGLVAFMFYILDRFSSQPIYATITEMMYALPILFIFFLTGVIADRFDRQKIAVNCDLINALLSVLILISIKVDFLPLVFVFLFIRSAISKFFNPAQSALLQGVLSKEDYPVGIGINQMFASIFFLTGSGIGAMVFWGIGINGAILIDAISFLISGWLIAKCSLTEEVRLPNGRSRFKDLSFAFVKKDFFSGIQYSLHNKIVLCLLSGILILGITNGAQSVMHIFIMKYKLASQNYEQIQVLLAAALGAGILIGSIVSTRLSKKIPLYSMIIASFMGTGFVLFSQASTSYVWLYLCLQFFQGLFVPLCNIAFFGWLGQIVDKKMMGRVQGLITPLMMLTITLMQGFIAIAYPKHIAVEVIFYIAGGSSILLGLFYLVTLPALAKKEKLKKSQKENVEVLSY